MRPGNKLDTSILNDCASSPMAHSVMDFILSSEITTFNIPLLSLTWRAVHIQRWAPTLEVRQHHLFLSALRGTARSVLCSCQTSGVRHVPEVRLPLMGLSEITCPSSSTECNERSSAFSLYQTGLQPTLCCQISSQLEPSCISISPCGGSQGTRLGPSHSTVYESESSSPSSLVESDVVCRRTVSGSSKSISSMCHHLLLARG